MRLQNRIFAMVTTIATLWATGTAWAGTTPEKRIAQAMDTIKAMAQEDDAGTMGRVIGKGVAIAIFPSVIKAGLVVGGQHGDGLLLRHDPKTGHWYGPSFYNVTGASVGFQIGVQSTALVLAVINEKGLKGFRGDNFTLGADVAVAAGPVGRRTSAATDINMNTPIYSYSMSKGLFAGVSLDGASIGHDPSANKLYWGSDSSPADLLNRRATSKKVAPLIVLLNDLIANKGK